MKVYISRVGVGDPFNFLKKVPRSKRLRDGNAVDYDVDMKKEQETYAMFSANWWYQYMKREIDERRVGRVYPPPTVKNLSLIDLSDLDVLVFANRANLRCELSGAVATHALVTTRHDRVRQGLV